MKHTLHPRDDNKKIMAIATDLRKSFKSRSDSHQIVLLWRIKDMRTCDRSITVERLAWTLNCNLTSKTFFMNPLVSKMFALLRTLRERTTVISCNA
ncbi:MAG: hypothetical protein F6K31_25685 [Symploca sp. SIO2G7]|nr:hypothetical protein [Symploca sp. SIO2G7]